MALTVDEAFEPLPESSGGGLIESVKTALMEALRKELTGLATTNTETNGIHVDMEYPVDAVHYPMVWVQFSTSVLKPSGMGHLTTTGETNLADRKLIQQWYYEGRATLSVVALSSLERDRISDKLIDVLAFPRIPVRSSPEESEYTSLVQTLIDNPYVSIQPNFDQIIPNGQSTTVGVPWEPNQLAYEDAYSFDVVGEFQKVFYPDGAVRLSRIDVIADNHTLGTNEIPRGTWI